MTKPRYQPFCARNCRDERDMPRAASEWVHIDGRTMFVCAQCARHLFGLPSPATVQRIRRRLLERMQESMDA